MTTSMSLSLYYLGFISSHTKNPLKLSGILVLYSGFVFFLMYLKSSQVWFPMLYFLLFMGGILMMFMILSSVMPNEKPGKAIMPSIKMFVLLFILMVTMWSKQEQMNLDPSSIKILMTTSMGFWILMLVLILYFFSTIFMIKSQKMPMRSVTC